MSSAGFARRGLKCRKCGLLFALSPAGIMTDRDLAKMPDPFLLASPLCKHDAEYAKGEIQILYSTGF
jgi:hypothetical protein